MARSRLKDYFPMIRTEGQLRDEIYEDQELRQMFESWEDREQQMFLDICCGAKGVKMLYDCFFKEIFHPDVHPERLEELLSILIEKKVKILAVLPNESVRMSDENTLLIMDIVVEMENGEIANVECQKQGYAFPGQRAACYSADLLMRQLRRIKGEKGKHFSYKDIKTVYTIIFYEDSPKEFRVEKEHYIHRSQQQTDTNVKVDLL